MVQGQFDEQDKSEPDPWPDDPKVPDEPKFIPAPFEPPSVDETMRRSGLAYSAGIVFFGSIAFMLFLGWIADLVFGTKPWGLVGGIVIGSVIGFIQFFRISSQIFEPEKRDHAIHPLLSPDDDDEPRRR
jgi:F0F1-type ATP synthase assembly protein I